jgi:predicted amidohydrolase YtcJ
MKGKAVDLIVRNAKIYSMDEADHEYEAMAIKDGKIVELGPERQILNKYSSDEEIDAEGKEIYPGFTDAHGHMMSYARLKLSVDLVGTSSMEDLLVRVEKYDQKKRPRAIVGRGWDQATWGVAELPDNEKLNKLFPNKAVILHRIDGHAALANQKALDLAGITVETKVPGGEIQVKDGKCTGILVDNAINLLSDKIPDFPQKDLKAALLEVQSELYQFGVTGVHEAGVSNKDLMLLKGMSESKALNLNLYVMLYGTKENVSWAKKHGVYEKGNFSVRSFKVMGDGALGSRGALLKKSYSDHDNHLGLLTTSAPEMEKLAQTANLIGYQLNIHAIGDSTNRVVLELIRKYTSKRPDHRWRVEHAQVVDPQDLLLFKESGAIASVQPTHAVSDQRWAELRLGASRLKGAYAYRTLLETTGMLALGTDFPVEFTNPFATIRAAVLRTNADGQPIGGFLPNEAVSLKDCLLGMTLWPAIAGFQEHRIGSLEVGKDATFFICSQDINESASFDRLYSTKTVLNGKTVYSLK